LITAINDEVDLLDERIEEDQEFIDALDQDLQAMQKEYAAMIYATQKTSAGFDELTFLFAAETFDQLFMRLKYMKQYTSARRQQSEQIKVVQSNLNNQIAEIQEQKDSKQSLLNEELQESNKLEGLRTEQRRIFKDLEKEESRIREALKKQRASEKDLSNRIDAIIEAERRAALLNSADLSVITEAFQQVKGRLRWPVEEGFVSSKYGNQKHPTLQISINNKGVDIQTSKDAYVKSVFNGKVVGVMSIQGQGITVLIQHGEFFTAYSKLKAVTVKQDDKIVEGQNIGQVLTGSDNVSEIKFRINDSKGTVNPESWLQSKIN
jgi:septal ring factor EnvC (AmiA/AmiB activator)